MDKATGIRQLTDAMATLRWSIWEMFPVEERTDKLEMEFAEMVRKRVEEYKQFDLEYEMSVVRER